MSKYIIRNCPCFFEENGEVNDYTCAWNGTEELACQDCTDCLLKRIVELCKPVKKEYLKHKLDMLIAGKFNIAGKILLLLDIQEVE